MASELDFQINDPLYGQVSLEEWEQELVALPEVQRLRHIKHLGLTYLIYPCAKYNRLEHTLGTLFLAKQFLKYVRPSYNDVDVRRIHAAILLHDIGQGPCSQVFNDVLKRCRESGVRESWTNKRERPVQKVRGGKLNDQLKQIIKNFWGVTEVDKEVDQICSAISGDSNSRY